MGGRLLRVQGLGQQPILQGQHHLDHAADTGSGLSMADIGFEGPQPERPLGGVRLAIGGKQRLALNGIAQRGPSAMGLHRIDILGRKPSAGQGLADDALLAGPLGALSPWLLPS